MLPLRILSALEALRYELLPPARGYAVIWGGRGELNAQENRVTVCPNIPVVSTATLVVHYLDDFGAPGRNPTPIFAIQRERSSINLQAQSCFGGVFPQP